MNTIDSVESFDWIHEISSTEKRLVERRIFGIRIQHRINKEVASVFLKEFLIQYQSKPIIDEKTMIFVLKMIFSICIFQNIKTKHINYFLFQELKTNLKNKFLDNPFKIIALLIAINNILSQLEEVCLHKYRSFIIIQNDKVFFLIPDEFKLDDNLFVQLSDNMDNIRKGVVVTKKKFKNKILNALKFEESIILLIFLELQFQLKFLQEKIIEFKGDINVLNEKQGMASSQKEQKNQLIAKSLEQQRQQSKVYNCQIPQFLKYQSILNDKENKQNNKYTKLLL